MVVPSLSVTAQWPLSLGKQEQVSLHLCLEELSVVAREMCFIPPVHFFQSRKHFQDPVGVRQVTPKESAGSFFQPEEF